MNYYTVLYFRARSVAVLHESDEAQKLYSNDLLKELNPSWIRFKNFAYPKVELTLSA